MARITSSAMARRALPGASRPAPGSAPKVIGLPILISIFPGRGTIRPGGRTRSVPIMATGMTGSLEFMASQPTPGRPRYRRPSGERVPSG